MTQHPEKRLTWSDIPPPAPGAAKYLISPLTTRGYAVLKLSAEDGRRSTLEHKASDQAAFRAAIRLQKRENAAAKKGNL